MNDELGLPAGALQRHDCQPGGSGSHLRAKIASNQVEAQVQCGRRACRGQNSAIVHIEHVRVHVYLRVAPSEFLGGQPVRRRLEAIQRPRTSKHERTGANRSYTGSTRDRASQRPDQLLGHGSIDRLDTRHDDCAGTLQ